MPDLNFKIQGLSKKSGKQGKVTIYFHIAILDRSLLKRYKNHIVQTSSDSKSFNPSSWKYFLICLIASSIFFASLLSQ